MSNEHGGCKPTHPPVTPQRLGEIERDEKIEAIVVAMASAGQELAVRWGHQPWSESWARLVAETMLAALDELDDAVDRAEVSGPDAVFCCDCMAPGRPSCDRDGHGLVTLGELIEAYS